MSRHNSHSAFESRAAGRRERARLIGPKIRDRVTKDANEETIRGKRVRAAGSELPAEPRFVTVAVAKIECIRKRFREVRDPGHGQGYRGYRYSAAVEGRTEEDIAKRTSLR